VVAVPYLFVNVALLLVSPEDDVLFELLELLLLVLSEDEILLELLVEGVSVSELLGELSPVLLEHPASADRTTASVSITTKNFCIFINSTYFPRKIHP